MADLDNVYSQRNELAVALAKLTIATGGSAGRGLDGASEDREWAHVVYIDLPDGTQVSWHMAPDDVHLLDGLPTYPGAWDGTFIGRAAGWTKDVAWGNEENPL